MTIENILSVGLWLAGIGHFCVLGASFQVPIRLNWKEDLGKLTRFNRKLMWTYGGFTVLTIIMFGLLTLVCHDEMLKGEKSALCIAAFIGVYWTTRIAVDFFYFTHDDWPKGPLFKLGHVLLTSLFSFLAFVYFAVAVWNLVRMDY